jgi:hypothetical protein
VLRLANLAGTYRSCGAALLTHIEAIARVAAPVDNDEPSIGGVSSAGMNADQSPLTEFLTTDGRRELRSSCICELLVAIRFADSST